jgi:hypothetical protein
MTDDQPILPAPESNGDAHNDAAHPNSNAVPEVKVPPPHKSYATTCDKKRDKWDIAKLVAEFVGLGFLILYTLYTAGIYCANKKAAEAAQDTLGEIQKQTNLARQQLVGSQAAVVSLNMGHGVLEVEPHPLKNNVNISIGLKNEGHVIGKSVEMRLRIQIFRISDRKYLGKQWTCDYPIPVISPDKTSYSQCFVDGLSGDNLRSIENMTQTIALDGEYTYNDGFDDIVKVPTTTDSTILLKFQCASDTFLKYIPSEDWKGRTL